MNLLLPGLLFLLLQAGDQNAQGVKALEEQRYADAATHFQKAIEADPKDYSAHFHFALACSFLERDEEAILSYRKVLELKPGLYEAELNLGMVLVRNRRFAEAVEPLRAAHEKKPGEVRPAYYLGEALFGTEQFAEAEKFYQAAAAADPKFGPAVVGIARAKARQGQLEEAAAVYQNASAIDPSLKEAVLELAAIYEASNQPRKAIEIYRQFPENPAARERLGDLLVKVGEDAEAVPHLEFAVKNSPTPANRLALAQAYLRLKQPEKGISLLAEVVASEPANYDLRMLYGKSLRDQKDYQGAARQFLEATKLRNDSAEAFSELAVVLILLDAYPQALGVLDRVQALGGEKPGHVYFRAVILDRMKQYEPALAAYQRFLTMSEGKSPNEEFKARQRIKVIQKELRR